MIYDLILLTDAQVIEYRNRMNTKVECGTKRNA